MKNPLPIRLCVSAPFQEMAVSFIDRLGATFGADTYDRTMFRLTGAPLPCEAEGRVFELHDQRRSEGMGVRFDGWIVLTPSTDVPPTLPPWPSERKAAQIAVVHPAPHPPFRWNSHMLALAEEATTRDLLHLAVMFSTMALHAEVGGETLDSPDEKRPWSRLLHYFTGDWRLPEDALTATTEWGIERRNWPDFRAIGAHIAMHEGLSEAYGSFNLSDRTEFANGDFSAGVGNKASYESTAAESPDVPPVAEGDEGAAFGPESPIPPPRFLLAMVRTKENAEKEVEKIPPWFIAGAEYETAVHIGPIDPNKRLLRLSEKFTEPGEPGETVNLMVHFVQLVGEKVTRSEAMTLPPEGASTPVRFSFIVPKDAPLYDARILVCRGGRILQTARLMGRVVTDAATMEGKEEKRQIDLYPEAYPRKNYSSLEKEEEAEAGTKKEADFGAAYFFNDLPDGERLVSIVSDTEIAVLDPGPIEKQMKELDGIFDYFAKAVAPDWQPAKGAITPMDEEFLRAAAISGNFLYHELKDGQEGPFPPEGKAVQILAKNNRRIPLELVYESEKSPDINATLCGSWSDCVNEGRCCQEDKEVAVFCPSRFWGISRVIERQTYNRSLAGPENPEWKLTFEPTRTHRNLQVNRAMLLGGSKRVDGARPNSMSELLESAESLAGEGMAWLENNWKDWRARVNEKRPGCLMLIVHTEKIPYLVSAKTMELGGDLSLHSGQFGQNNEIAIPPIVAKARPMVVLLGCNTGTGDIPYADIVNQAGKAGASVVIGAGPLLNVLHVVPFAQLLIKMLGEITQERPFGEFMRELRVRSLLEGNAVGMALTAYGDADWLLVNKSSQSKPL